MTCTVMEMHFVFDVQVQDYVIGLMGVRQSFVEMMKMCFHFVLTSAFHKNRLISRLKAEFIVSVCFKTLL